MESTILAFLKKEVQYSDHEDDPEYSEGDESDQKDLSEWTRVKAIHSMRTLNIQLFDLRKYV